MTLVILLAALSAAPLEPLDGDPAVACRASCARHVPASLMPRVCAECIRKRDPAAWTDAFGRSRKLPESTARSAMGDPLWEVRWGVLKAQARAAGKNPTEVLYGWLKAQRSASDRVTACRVAVSAGAVAEGRVLEAARKGCKAVREEVRAAIEPELYLPAASAQEEALRKLMLFLDEGPGRVVLRAIRARPEALDEVPALLLHRVATPEVSVGKMLLAGADASTQREMNRLLSVYSRQIDSLRPALSAPEAEKRRDAVRALAVFLPMTEPELQRAVSDRDDAVALAAFGAIADANGRDWFEELVLRAQRWGEQQTPVDAQVREVRLLGRLKEQGCGPRLESLFNDERLAAEVRGAALAALGRCDEGDVMAQIRFGLASNAPAIRAASLRALGEQSGKPGSGELAAQALGDEAPEVVAAALRILGGQKTHAARVAALAGHEAPEVRLAAAEYLAKHGRSAQLPVLKARVGVEPEPAIRVELVRALAALGGPIATATLAEVERSDSDEYVRQAATSGLRRMLR